MKKKLLSFLTLVALACLPMTMFAQDGSFAVTVIAATNGTLTVDKESANAGDEVTITATPDDGFKLKSILVQNIETGDAIAVADSKFTMPAAAVQVSAVFNQYVDVTISPASGNISEALATELAGNDAKSVTINLAEGAAYTVDASIESAGNVVINGAAGAMIDASALAGPFIKMSATPVVEANENGGYEIDGVIIKDVVITGLAHQLVYANKTNYLMGQVLVENSVVGMKGAAKKTFFDFNGGGNTLALTVNKTTLWTDATTTHQNGGFYSSQRGKSVQDLKANAIQKTTITNSTLYNIAYKATTSSRRKNSQDWILYEVKNSVIVNSGKSGQFLKGLNAGQAGKDSEWDVDGNVFNFDGANVEEQNVGSTAGNVKNSIAGIVTFADAAAGDFTVDASSQVALYKTGDPRWLTEFSAVQLVTTAASGYTTLVSKYPLDFTSAGELKAYVVAAATDVDATAKTVKLTAITEAAANTPVILYGEKSTDYTITAKADAAAVENNLLKGDATKDATLADDEAYLLKDGKFGLCKAGTLPAGKAYLPATTSGARELVIVFDGDATGIDDVTRDALENGKIYNLQGQEVKKAGKGIFIINGKKVVIK